MLHSLSTAYRSWAFKVTIWLILAAIAAGLTVMVWFASAVKPANKLSQKNIDNPVIVDPLVLLNKHDPDEMKQMVKPVTFDAVIRDMRNYPKEFKDSRFIKANQGKWTVQVMNVVENEVITDYLNNRQDRDKFNYFRIVDENNQKRFVVTYGVFNSAQEAISAAKAVNFGLPNNVSTFPEEFDLYASQIDEYEITPPLKDLGKNAPRDVKLRSAQKELPAPKAKPKPPAQTQSRTQPKEQPKKAQASDENPRQAAPKPTRTIKESTDKQETLNIQEKKVTKTPKEPPKSESKPLKIQKGEAPAIEAPPAPKEKPAGAPPPEPAANENP